MCNNESYALTLYNPNPGNPKWSDPNPVWSNWLCPMKQAFTRNFEELHLSSSQSVRIALVFAVIILSV